MAFLVKTDTGNHVTIKSKLQDLIDGSTITTMHTAEVVRVGNDFFLCILVYEGT